MRRQGQGNATQSPRTLADAAHGKGFHVLHAPQLGQCICSFFINRPIRYDAPTNVDIFPCNWTPLDGTRKAHLIVGEHACKEVAVATFDREQRQSLRSVVIVDLQTKRR
jgi:hypothetical protein